MLQFTEPKNLFKPCTVVFQAKQDVFFDCSRKKETFLRAKCWFPTNLHTSRYWSHFAQQSPDETRLSTPNSAINTPVLSRGYFEVESSAENNRLAGYSVASGINNFPQCGKHVSHPESCCPPHNHPILNCFSVFVHSDLRIFLNLSSVALSPVLQLPNTFDPIKR